MSPNVVGAVPANVSADERHDLQGPRRDCTPASQIAEHKIHSFLDGRGYGGRHMRRLPWSSVKHTAAATSALKVAMVLGSTLVATACGGSDEKTPTPSPYGLDSRPVNATCLAPAKRPLLDTGLKLERQWANIGFQAPIFLTQAPGDNTRWYVVERGGKVRTFLGTATGNGDLTEFASLPVNTGGEGGLLGFGFHPQWPTKREAYLSYTRNPVGGDPAAPNCGQGGGGSAFVSVIGRYQSTNNGASLNIGPDEILKIAQPFSNHNGGGINFGPDGMLYFGVGDGGSGNDPCASGQDLTSLLGKFLRIDIDAPAGMYKIPTDNPFVTTPANAKKEIWALGVRNPWRWSFDKSSGEMWVGEVGQGTWEEVDRVVKGGNYGWKTCEGFHRLGSTTALCNTQGMADPIVAHPRGEARSITGGYVYRGTAMPSLVGTYIYGDYETGNIWALTYGADNRPIPKVVATVGGATLVSFAQGNDGEVYTIQINGVISKLVPAAPPPPDGFPKLLSETGCFDPADPRKPGTALIPYDVNSQLWSDGADKGRWFALPDDTTITIDAEQDWLLPVGSVVVKEFAVEGKRLETRLFMRHAADGGWGGYTYEWNEEGTDAVLLVGSKVKPIDGGASGQAWAYPSRSQCIQCHSAAANGILGLETSQLNREVIYTSTNRISPQLDTLQRIGVVTLPAPPAESPKLPDPVGETGTLEERARAYLHANCSHCHRPEGGGQGMMDLRISKTFTETRTCDVDNTQGTVEGATKLIVPGSPEMSILSRRMHATDAKRMPPVAVSIVDEAGSKVIDDWIRSLTACP